MTDQDAWRSYLERFHADAPGVTERMLTRARDAGVDPYRWAAAAVPTEGLVVDVACGSAPIADHLPVDRYVGADRSRAELALAARRVGGRVARADAAALPFADGCADTVTCTMGLMLTRPLDAVLREIRRILRPGGRLVAVVPTARAGSLGDALRWGALLAALRMRGLRWPNPQVTRPVATWLDDGFTIVGDERRAFRYPIDDEASARRLLASLYLPDVPDERIERAVRIADSWVGRSIGVPLRRVIARR